VGGPVRPKTSGRSALLARGESGFSSVKRWRSAARTTCRSCGEGHERRGCEGVPHGEETENLEEEKLRRGSGGIGG
jgi:hypothetical protein